MANPVDLQLLPLSRRAGQDQPTGSGLFVPRKPRRPARSREADQLLIHLALVGNATLPLDLGEQLTGELAQVYYDTSGSVTTALRATAEALNQALLKKNLQSSGSSQQTVGYLSLVTLRSEQIYLAQSGPVYALYLGADQAQEYYDPSLTGRGLGINQAVSQRYFYASLLPGDTLFLASQPDPAWSVASCSHLYGQSIDYQQSWILNQVSDTNAVLVHVTAGTGQVQVLPFRPSQPALPRQETTPDRITPQASQPILASEGAVTEKLPPIEVTPEPYPSDLVQRQAMLDQYQPLPELDSMNGAASSLASEALSVSPPARETPAGAAPVATAAVAAATAPPARRARSGPGLGHRFGQALQRGLNRLLPEETIASIPSSIMAMMAIVIPLVIVVMATAVYFQRGLAAQSEIAYAQAVEAVAQAQVQLDPLGRREGFNVALSYLDAADSYRKLPQVQTLRQQILVELDNLDLVRRLNYQPAIIGGLPANLNIRQIVAVDNDLYLLDGSSGRVLRAFSTNQGYQLDNAFECGPGSPANLGPLIDLSAWPVGNSPDAAVVGMDAKGLLLFCKPGTSPQFRKLPDSPQGELRNLLAFALDYTDVYVLDSDRNAVWVYYNADFEGEPADYFGEQKLPLQDVTDLAANSEDLYLLHSDGRMAVCSTGPFGENTPNRCDDPAPYVDMRAGMNSAPLTPVPLYTQIQSSPPPDPSLFLLYSTRQAIDRYSLRNLTYQSRYLPAAPLSGEVSAAYVDPINRLVFAATGNRVYYASAP